MKISFQRFISLQQKLGKILSNSLDHPYKKINKQEPKFYLLHKTKFKAIQAILICCKDKPKMKIMRWKFKDKMAQCQLQQKVILKIFRKLLLLNHLFLLKEMQKTNKEKIKNLTMLIQHEALRLKLIMFMVQKERKKNYPKSLVY